MRRLLPLCLAVLAFGNVARAAEDRDLSLLLPLSLEELLNTPVVTASRQPETRGHSPAHIVVITREQIRERRYHNLADLMEDLPGVDFMRGTKSSAYNNFAVQGYAGPNKVLVMLDGIRVGHPAGGNFPVAENFSLYPARQVEILYGPAAALYGADAVAGVINIISDPAAQAPGASVSLGSGSFGAREASFTGNVNNGSLALSMGGHWQQADRAPLDQYYRSNFPKVAVGTIAAADRENYVGGIGSDSLYARLDAGDDLSFGYYRNHFRSLTSTGDTPATALYREDAYWDTTTDTLYGKYRFTLAPDLSGELVVDYSLQEISPNSKYMNVYTAFDSGYEYAYGERLSIEQHFNWKLDERNRVLAGLGYQKNYAIEAHSLSRPYNTDLDPSAQNQFYNNTSGTIPIRVYDARFHNASLYTQLQTQWNERFSSMAGVRYDRHSEYGGSLNMRLGAVWRPRENHYLKLLYGEAFRAPSPEESLSSFGSFSLVAGVLTSNRGFRLPNFDLEPEKAKTLSLTWDWRPRPALNLVASTYHSRIENLIITGPSKPDDITSMPGAVLKGPRQKINAGWEEHIGLDLMAQYRFQLNPGWSGDLWGSCGWIRGSIVDATGTTWDIPFAADYKVKLGTTFRYLDRVSITPRLVWIGDTRNDVKTTAPNRRITPGYSVTDLHIGWHKLINGKANAWLEIHNLFDKRYYAAAGAGSFVDMPQQPRTWTISLEYPF